LKKEHPKAVHFVYAYRVLNDFNQIVEDKSDDGEPKGTSGMPTLNVLRGYDLINAALITVRYFGGIKLGTGGLVRAYSDAANTVINNSSLLSFELKKNITIAIDLKNLNRFEHFLKTYSFNFTKDFKDCKAILHIKLNEKEEQEFEIFCKNFAPFEIEKL
ncbi:YigZ family protein, partial [Campylobacter jejuni]|nr:YigZ family protein [Campylobacter jejuni]EKN7440494.1 YigZ family protein [Campylobacter jejuni]